jgi:hypothetical protein
MFNFEKWNFRLPQFIIMGCGYTASNIAIELTTKKWSSLRIGGNREPSSAQVA